MTKAKVVKAEVEVEVEDHDEELEEKVDGGRRRRISSIAMGEANLDGNGAHIDEFYF